MLAVAVVLGVLGAVPAWAAEGDLDLSFNGSGKVVTLLGSATNEDDASGLAIDGQGRLVLAGTSTAGSGGFALVRYQPNGNVDPTFGGGQVITQVGTSSSGNAVAIDSQGRIVAAGADQGSNGSFDIDFAVARFRADGSLDPTFNGTGKVQTPVTTSTDRANAVLVDAQDRVIAAGIASPSTQDFAVVRYTAAGAPDPAFGTGGIVTTDFEGGTDRAFAAALDHQGRILLAGYASVAGGQEIAVVRYLSDGTLDPSFGTGGKKTFGMGGDIANANGVAVDSQGRILVAGGGRNGTVALDLAVARLLPDGTLDPSFGSGGKVLVPIGSNDDLAGDVTVDRQDRPVIAGTTSNGSINKWLVARFRTDGSLDTSFGGTGSVITSIGPSSDGASAVAIDGQDRIVTAGSSNGSNNYAHFAAVRYVGDAVAPTASVTSGPAAGAAVNTASPAFGFTSSEAGSTFTCRFDLLALTSCTSPTTPGAALADGPHVFGVVATDRAGNASAEATRSFTVDTAAPVVAIGGGPSEGSFTKNATPSFTLTSSEAGTFSCHVDAGAAAPCTSPFSVPARLADGHHVFAAVAIDAAGNASAQATRGFTVDTLKPRVKITGRKVTRIRSRRGRAHFRLRTSEKSRMRCRVDQLKATTCKAKYATPSLKPGRHKLTVTATDRAGNVRRSTKRFRIVRR